jgi:hypothetical protein
VEVAVAQRVLHCGSAAAARQARGVMAASAWHIGHEDNVERSPGRSRHGRPGPAAHSLR